MGPARIHKLENVGQIYISIHAVLDMRQIVVTLLAINIMDKPQHTLLYLIPTTVVLVM